MKHASLFSGIGGAELAAEWMGWDNIFHCEINPFGRRVLDYWFPKSKSYEDITKTDFKEWRGKVDVLTGGFPCQPFSQAGKRKGDTDDRYLWPQMLRAIREIRPTWVVGENVAGIVTMVESCEEVEMGRADDIFEENIIYRKEQEFTIERICKDFEREGYSVQPIVIPACAVGAPHRRDRVWFIANTDSVGGDRTCRKSDREKKDQKVGADILGKTKGFGNEWATTDTGLQRQKKSEQQAMGNFKLYESKLTSNSECSGGRKIHNEVESEQSDGNGLNSNGNERIITNTKSDGSRRKLLSRQRKVEFNRQNSGDLQSNWKNFPTQSPICCGNDGISDRLDGITFPKWRAESIKAYGNAWVPQVAYEIFKAIESVTTK